MREIASSLILVAMMSGCAGGNTEPSTKDSPAASATMKSAATAKSTATAAKPTGAPAQPAATTTQPTTQATQPAAQPTQPATTQSAAPGAAQPAAGGAGAMGPDGLPLDIPATKSKVPTVAEWDAVKKEITVARSTPLGCETKMVREWLRVSCRNKNNTGGEPTNAETKVAGGVEAYTFAKNKIASVVVPVVRAKHYEATFSWTDKKQTLVVDWPNGAPRPTIKFTD